MMHTASTVLMMSLLLGGPGGEEGARGSAAVVRHCQVRLIRDNDVYAQENGLLTRVLVKEGDVVRDDALLGHIDDRQALLQKEAAELERDAALTRASDNIEVLYAIKSFELAEAELNRSLEINRQSPGAVPAAELHRQRLDKHRAELQIDRSRLDLKVARMTAEVQNAAVLAAEESILRRRIAAPFAGIVQTVYRDENEWVNAGEPVFRVIQLDQLRIEGFLDGTLYDPEDVLHRAVTVETELARGRRESFSGQVELVNDQVQAGHKYRIRAVVENRRRNGHWLLRPGMDATMTIQLEGD